MSSLLNPVGPEPASVYWRRRIVVILGILVVLFMVWWLIKPSSSATPAADASPSPLPTLATTSPTPTPSTSAATGAPCQDTDIVVTVTSDQSAFSVGSPATFVMKITNNGAVACSRDVGPAANTFTVTSGGFDVWSSDACAPSSESQVEEIPAGEAFAVKGTWDGTVSVNGCGPSAAAAEPGAYQVVATNDGVSSEPLSFAIG